MTPASDPADSPPARPAGDPYVGLKPYTEAERDRFFGRERDAELLINKIFSHPLTLLYAPSGAGKTSLLRALVIPDLEHKEEAQVVYFDQWNSPDPVACIAARVDEGTAAPAAGAANRLVHAAKARLAREDRTLVLILDQFEEYLQRYAARLGDLPAAVGGLVRGGADLRVVIAFREEFLASVDACLREHVLALFASTYHLEHLDRERAGEAIRRPALVYGGECEDAFVERLLDDLAPHSDVDMAGLSLHRGGIELPFLQLVCRRLWEHTAEPPPPTPYWRQLIRSQGGDRSKPNSRPALRLDDYKTLGECTKIVRDHLQKITRPLRWWRRFATALVLQRLAPRSGVKVSLPAESLARRPYLSQRYVEGLLKFLADESIVRSRDAAGGFTYELQHDAFIKIVQGWVGLVFAITKGGLATLVVVMALGGGGWAYRQLQDQEARIQAADREQAARDQAEDIRRAIPKDTREALRRAVDLARNSQDAQVQATLRAALATFLRNPTLPSPAGPASAVAVSRDGQWVVAAGTNGVGIIDVLRLESRLLVADAIPAVAVALSRDAGRIALAGANGLLQVLDRDGNKLDILGGAGQPPWFSVDISADGRRVVGIQTTTDDSPPAPVLAEVATGAPLRPLKGMTEAAWSASFDEAGEHVLAYGAGPTAFIWDATGQPPRPLHHLGEDINGAHFAEHGRSVVVVTGQAIYRWDTDRQPPRSWRAAETGNNFIDARISPDGRWLAASRRGKDMQLWDLHGGGAAGTLPGANRDITTFHFSDDGKYLLALGADGAVLVWREPFDRPGQSIDGPKVGAHAARLDSDASHLLIAGADGSVQRVRFDQGDPPPSGEADKPPAAVSGRSEFMESRDRASSPETANLVTQGAQSAPVTLTLAPDKKRIARSSTDGTLEIRPTSAEPTDPPEFSEKLSGVQIYVLDFDETGRRLASGGSDGRIRLYEEQASGKFARSGGGEIVAHSGPVLSLDLHTDGNGTLLVSAGADGRAQVWGWDGTLLSILESESERVREVRFSADGRHIIKLRGDRPSTFDCDVWCKPPGTDLVNFADGLLNP